MARNEIPELTADQRRAALEKAVETRVARAEIKKRMKNRELTMKDLIERADDDPVIGGMKVYSALTALPGFGKVKAERVMNQLSIAKSRRMAGLGAKQRKEIIERLG